MTDCRTMGFKYANPAACLMFGYTEDEMTGLSVLDIHPKDSQEEISAAVQAHSRGETTKVAALPCLRKDGTIFYADISSTLMEIDGVPCLVGFFTDITDRKKAEAALRNSEKKYRDLVERINDVVFEVDGGGCFTYISPKVRDLLEYEPEDLVGRNFIGLVHPGDRDRLVHRFAELTKGVQYPAEYRLQTQSGRTVWVRTRTTPAMQGNTFLGGQGTIIDITDRKKVEQALLESTALLDSFMEALPDMVYIKDTEGRWLRVNAAFEEAFNIDRHAVIGKTTQELLSADQANQVRARDEEVIRSKAPFFAEQQLINEKGETVFYDTRKFPVLDDRGNVVSIVGISRDITQRKQAEEALRDSEERFRQLAENIGEVFWLTVPGRHRRVGYYSPAHEQVYGVPREHAYQNPGTWRRCLHSEDRANVLRAYDDFIQGENEYNVEYRIVRPDGSIRWIWDRAFPIRDRDGALIRVAGLAQDVTDRKIAEESRNQLTEEMKRFTYIVSHDLRAPLTNIRCFSREVQSAVDALQPIVEQALPFIPDEQRRKATLALQQDLPEALTFIGSSVTRMDHLIERILQLSRVGRMDLAFRPLNMNRLTDDVLDSFAHEIQETQATVRVAELPETVADLTAMEQIMGNLIGNAIKYRDRGRPLEISITGHRFSDETVFVVRDTGTGIDPHALSRVFQVFQRATTQDVPGEGMGLAYARTLVRRHGGRIWCESEPGGGAVFTFTISNNLVR